VRGTVRGVAMAAAAALEPAERDALSALGWKPEDCTALPLGPRGSARTFTRVRRGARSVMLVRYDPARLENTLYVGHTRFLARLGVPVPRILFDDAQRCVTILQDLGDLSIEAWIKGRSTREVRSLYERVLDGVLTFHEAGGAAARRERLQMVPSFRPALYRWERDYFAEHMLRNRERRPAAEITRLKRELAAVAARLQRAPRVLVHRDLQSSNILLARGRPCFIDYQGMRYGAAVYDLASLLCDPYVELPEEVCRHLLDYYAARCRAPRLVRELFWYGVLQRLAQALGAYAKLGASADTRHFAQYIPPALRMLDRALARVPGLPALKAWCVGAHRSTAS
jgi:aminoglycoside/choline kinase family phosphotransferase